MAGRSWATCCSSCKQEVWQELSCCSWPKELHPFFSPEGEFLLCLSLLTGSCTGGGSKGLIPTLGLGHPCSCTLVRSPFLCQRDLVPSPTFRLGALTGRTIFKVVFHKSIADKNISATQWIEPFDLTLKLRYLLLQSDLTLH